MGQFWPRSCRPQDAEAETQEILGIPARLRRCGWPDTRGKRTVGTVHHAPACSVASTTVPIHEPQPACFCKFLACRRLARALSVQMANTGQRYRVAQLMI